MGELVEPPPQQDIDQYPFPPALQTHIDMSAPETLRPARFLPEWAGPDPKQAFNGHQIRSRTGATHYDCQ